MKRSIFSNYFSRFRPLNVYKVFSHTHLYLDLQIHEASSVCHAGYKEEIETENLIHQNPEL